MGACPGLKQEHAWRGQNGNALGGPRMGMCPGAGAGTQTEQERAQGRNGNALRMGTRSGTCSGIIMGIAIRNVLGDESGK